MSCVSWSLQPAFFTESLKVPSHQIRLGFKSNEWIGLGEYKDHRW
jgi:hypothetical protein